MKNTFLNNSKTTKMCYTLWFLSIKDIKEKITLPKEPIKITKESVLFTYYLNDNIRFFNFFKGEEGALELMERGIISDFTGLGSNLTMYRKKIITWEGQNGVPLQTEGEVEFTWDELLDLWGWQIIDIVANHEYKLTGRVAGFFEYKKPAKIRDLVPRNKDIYSPTPAGNVQHLKVA